MLVRRLFCVNDPSHADFGWSAESRFLHTRKYDACGNTIAQWTVPVADTVPGEVTCAVCGGAVYVAGAPLAVPGTLMACDFLGRCRDIPIDANLGKLDSLARNLAETPYPAARARLAPVVAALFVAVADDPAALAVLERHRIKDLYPVG